jgi:hypothetical protein
MTGQITTIPHTRSFRGRDASRRLRSHAHRSPQRRVQRMQRSAVPIHLPYLGEDLDYSVRSEDSRRSYLFHQNHCEDTSLFDVFSLDALDASPVIKEECATDTETVSEESLYTTNYSGTPRDWEEAQVEYIQDRERKMLQAGFDNSIPTTISGGSTANVSKLSMFSTRSMLYSMQSMMLNTAPTEPAESLGASIEEENRVLATLGAVLDDGDADSLFPKPRLSLSTEKCPRLRRRSSLIKRLWKTLFSTSSKQVDKSRRQGLMRRQSAPIMRSSALRWDPADPPVNHSSTSTLNASNVNCQRARHHSAPVGSAPPLDLFLEEKEAEKSTALSDVMDSVEQHAESRGIPLARLRVSTNGVLVWENASGRLLPFSAAEI